MNSHNASHGHDVMPHSTVREKSYKTIARRWVDDFGRRCQSHNANPDVLRSPRRASGVTSFYPPSHQVNPTNQYA